MANLDSLKKRRETILSELNDFKQFIDSYNVQTSEYIEQLEIRLDGTQDLWNNFDCIQVEIEDISDVDESSHRKDFRKTFFDTVGVARHKWKQHNQRNQTNTPPGSHVSNTSTDSNLIRLPKFDLPTFEGNYESWLGFHDVFKSVIHDRTDLPEIQKLHYLRSCLKGEAATVIKSLDTSSDSYAEAWTLLNERYNNKRVIIFNHLRALLKFPPIAKESAQALRQLLDHINSHVRALKALEEKVDGCKSLFIYLMTEKIR